MKIAISIFLAIYYLFSTADATSTFAGRAQDLDSVHWPEGTEVLRFDDVDGLILVPATLTSAAGVDTSGDLVLDTGAGHLAVDLGLSRALGLSERVSGAAAVEATDHPLALLRLGGLRFEQVWPVLAVDAGVIRRVTGRPVLGLIGQVILRDRVVVLDYASGTAALLPPERGSLAVPDGPPPSLSRSAVAVPFRVVADGKAVLQARAVRPGGSVESELILILDTGATKTVLFGPSLDRRLPAWRSWPALRGLGAATLRGDAMASIVRLPGLELGPPGGAAGRSGVDAAVLGGELPRMLEEAVGGPVDGLLGYSFLKHFRVAIDYPRRLLWLDPGAGGVPDRPEEYCQPGIQLESADGSIRVMAVARGSPAARAGVRAGDELVAVDGDPVSGGDVVAIGRRLEGRPGSEVVLRLRRGHREWTRRVVRARLL
jgi:hypothetical protein